MHTVELITQQQPFLALEGEWNDAVERAGVPHPFLRHEWLRAWWTCFGAGHQLHISVVRFDGRIGAIAPLMFERSQMYGVPIRRVRLMHNDHTPRADFVIAERADRADESYRLIWESLVAARGAWDVLQLGQLTADSPTCESVRRLAAIDGHGTGVWDSSVSPYLPLASNWDGFLASLPSKFRQNLRNRLTRLTQIGAPALEVLDDPAAIKDGRADAIRLEDSGWKHSEGTAIDSNDAVRRFYTLLTENAAAYPWLRLLFLTVGGKRIATSLAAVYGGRLFLIKTGYDADYAKCSPFKLLTYFAVRHAHENGLTEVDFLGDSEPWKLEWTTCTRAHHWLFVFSGTPRARLLHPIKFQVLPAIKRCTSQHSRV